MNRIDQLGLSEPAGGWSAPAGFSVRDHFKWGGTDIHRDMTAWFDLRYKGWVGVAKSRAKRLANERVASHCGSFPEDVWVGYEQVVRPKYDKVNTPVRILLFDLFGKFDEVPESETRYGDEPQTPWEANSKGPGSFWFKLDYVSVTWQCDCCFCWEGILYILDDKGLSPDDYFEAPPDGISMAQMGLLGLIARDDEMVVVASWSLSDCSECQYFNGD